MTAADPYAWWRAKLQNQALPPPAGIDSWQPGYYEGRNKAKERIAVAYWFGDDGKVMCTFNGRPLSEQRALEAWPFVCRRAISYDTYTAALSGTWPDESPAAIADRVNSSFDPDPNSFECLKDRIEDLAREAGRLISAGGAQTQEAVDQAADLANRIAELAKSADDARKREKDPHDAAAKAVQKKWAPLLEAADIYKRIKIAVITPFLAAQKAKRDAEAEAARLQAKALEKAGVRAPELAPLPKIGAGNSTRRTVALREYKIAVITDYEAALAALKNTLPVREAVQQAANAAVKAGATVAGVEVKTEERAA